MENARYIEVDAGVRYWDDAILNGKEDVERNIPLRRGDRWQPIIELSTGRILDWPEGTKADIHYKVCDNGDYWLLDEAKRRIAKRKGYYVPDDILCIGDNGYGDYIILIVGDDGRVMNWTSPCLDRDEWEENAASN